tara:strand:+ start:376 stop:810 length:435 start_codon:yes stop_codon:yes gene_type:complete
MVQVAKSWPQTVELDDGTMVVCQTRDELLATITNNPFTLSHAGWTDKTHADTDGLDTTFAMATGTLWAMKEFFAADAWPGDDIKIVYTSSLVPECSLWDEDISPEHEAMMKNMVGSIKFDYIGDGYWLEAMFDSFDLEFEPAAN